MCMVLTGIKIFCSFHTETAYSLLHNHRFFIIMRRHHIKLTKGFHKSYFINNIIYYVSKTKVTIINMYQNNSSVVPYWHKEFFLRFILKDLPCSELWKKHVQKRWNFWSRVGHVGSTYSTVFSDSERAEDFHKVYLIKHFLDLLNYCCLNVHVPGEVLLTKYL